MLESHIATDKIFDDIALLITIDKLFRALLILDTD